MTATHPIACIPRRICTSPGCTLEQRLHVSSEHPDIAGDYCLEHAREKRAEALRRIGLAAVEATLEGPAR